MGEMNIILKIIEKVYAMQFNNNELLYFSS